MARKSVKKDNGITFVPVEIIVRNCFDLDVGQITYDEDTWIFVPNGEQFLTQQDLLEVHDKVAELNGG